MNKNITLKERISSDYMTAFKNRDTIKKILLSTVQGEIQTIEKNIGQDNLSDPDVMKILTKMCKSLNETLKEVNHVESEVELSILSEYMPKQMSREEITSKLETLIKSSGSPLNIGMVMKSFVNDPVDKKIVLEIFNNINK